MRQSLELPQGLRNLGANELSHLADDLRQEILSACLKNGGHLGASLGAVELAIALHRCFESPREAIVWDVGHQAYAHKLLTGRWDRFGTLRTTGGISGFLSRDESPHDVFGAGHSSTALSAALGIAANSKEWTVAVVGDGGLTAGLALEALNNVRAANAGPLLLVVNDNQMSISENVGALPAILAGGRAREFFDLFGMDFVGPIDGHDIDMLVGTLAGIRKGYSGRPVALHVLTQKGKGYAPAEEQPSSYHGVGPLQAKVPGTERVEKKKRSYSDAFGEALCEVAAADERVNAITAAMPDGTGLLGFARKFPQRFFDVGIAEPHAVTFAAGLATRDKRPVVAIYSTFLQRALDEIIHDVALQALPVVFAVDRAGVVGADGPTHHGAFDLAYLGSIPGLVITSPACLSDLTWLLRRAVSGTQPFAIRYPRGSGPESYPSAPDTEGLRWHSRPAPLRAIVVSFGAATERAQEAVAAVGSGEVGFVSALFAKPVSGELIKYLNAHRETPLLIVEDGAVRGGFGQALAGSLEPRSGHIDFAGYPDRFLEHGSVADLEETAGVSARQLQARLSRLMPGSA